MKLNAAKLSNTTESVKKNTGSDTIEADEREYSIGGEIVQTSTVDRPPESTIHTNYDLLSTAVSDSLVIFCC